MLEQAWLKLGDAALEQQDLVTARRHFEMAVLTRAGPARHRHAAHGKLAWSISSTAKLAGRGQASSTWRARPVSQRIPRSSSSRLGVLHTERFSKAKQLTERQLAAAEATKWLTKVLEVQPENAIASRAMARPSGAFSPDSHAASSHYTLGGVSDFESSKAPEPVRPPRPSQPNVRSAARAQPLAPEDQGPASKRLREGAADTLLNSVSILGEVIEGLSELRSFLQVQGDGPESVVSADDRRLWRGMSIVGSHQRDLCGPGGRRRREQAHLHGQERRARTPGRTSRSSSTAPTARRCPRCPLRGQRDPLVSGALRRQGQARALRLSPVIHRHRP